MRVLTQRDVIVELARATGKWLVYVNLDNWAEDWPPDVAEQTQLGVPWLDLSEGNLQPLMDGWALAICDDEDEAVGVFSQVYGDDHANAGVERPGLRERFYACTISPSGDYVDENT
jgi:hypothetical protein